MLGTTEETSFQAASALQKYGMEPRAYTDFDEMVSAEKPDAVVIASPSSTHHEYLLRCVDSGLHTFCEKPFIWGDDVDIPKEVEEIFGKARKKKVTIAMNSQWSFSLDDYEETCGGVHPDETTEFFMRMSPFSPGRTMIPESVPHPLSILYCRLGAGKIQDLSFGSDGKGEMDLRFTYRLKTRACEVVIKLVNQKTPPRELSFGFNDKIVFRSLDLKDYGIYFNYGGKKIKITDPLSLSIKNFLEAVQGKTEPLIGYPHIRHNMFLLKEIDDRFGEFEKRKSWKS